MLSGRPGGLQALALLAFALLAPAALPAGGGERRLPEVRRRQLAGEPLLAGDRQALQSAPSRQAPVIHQVGPDQPLRVLGRWWSDDGQAWLRVDAGARRGWLVEAES